MTCKIKICGLSREEDVLYCNEYKPDYIGFVFFSKSKRCVTPELAAGLRKKLDPDIAAVGVFVDEDPLLVSHIANSGCIDYIQLHGHEDNDYIDAIRMMCDLPVIRAFRITEDTNYEEISESHADVVLLDAEHAGSGVSFDWDALKNVDRKFFLAGGLCPENAADAAKTGAFALDVSSGVEEDGRKNKDKIRQFIENVRKEEIL